jgi:hypothetical protein
VLEHILDEEHTSYAKSYLKTYFSKLLRKKGVDGALFDHSGKRSAIQIIYKTESVMIYDSVKQSCEISIGPGSVDESNKTKISKFVHSI